ncbi:MAG: DUF2339 domain-containing protein [Candidatus Brocadiia bacterium]
MESFLIFLAVLVCGLILVGYPVMFIVLFIKISKVKERQKHLAIALAELRTKLGEARSFEARQEGEKAHPSAPVGSQIEISEPAPEDVVSNPEGPPTVAPVPEPAPFGEFFAKLPAELRPTPIFEAQESAPPDETPADEAMPVSPVGEPMAAVEPAVAPPIETVPATAEKRVPVRPLPAKHESFESVIGMRVFVWVGIIAVIVAAGLFMKYVYEHQLISPALRIALGMMAGAAMIAAGWFFRRKNFAALSQGMVGGGIAVLYLSVYSAFAFYDLFSPNLAFALMIVITAVAFSHALMFDSMAVAVIGLLGSFTTPLMINTGVRNDAGLFGYIACLNIALLLMIAFRKKWRILKLFSLLGSYGWYVVWLASFWEARDPLWTPVIAGSIWLPYFISDFMQVRDPETSDYPSLVAGWLNVAFFFTGVSIGAPDDNGKIIAQAIVGGCYGLAVLALKPWRSTAGEGPARFVLSGAAGFFCSIAFMSDGWERTALWSLDLAVLVWAAERLGIRWVAFLGLAAFVAPLGQCFSFSGEASKAYSYAHAFPCWREAAFGALMLATCWSAMRKAAVVWIESDSLKAALKFAFVAVILIATSIELRALWPTPFGEEDLVNFAWMILVVSALSGVFVLAYRKSDIQLAVAALIGFAIACVDYSFSDLWIGRNAAPVMKCARESAGIVALLAFAGSSFLSYRRTETGWQALAKMYSLLAVVVSLFLVAFSTVDLLWLFGIVHPLDYAVYLYPLSFSLVAIALLALFLRTGRTFDLGLTVSVVIVSVVAVAFSYTIRERLEFVPAVLTRLLGLSGFLAASLMTIHTARKHGSEKWSIGISESLGFITCCAVVLAASFETRHFFASLPRPRGNMFLEDISLPIVWALLAVLFAWARDRGKLLAYLISSGIVGSMALALGLIKGYAFFPVVNFIPILNLRFALMLLLIVSVWVISRRMACAVSTQRAGRIATNLCSLVCLLIGLFALTVEAKDLFASSLIGATTELRTTLEYARGLSYSGIWLIYAVVCLIVGFLLERKWLRLFAISVLAIAVLKIFLFDLSFLEGLFRILSFFGLAVVLLGASYIYHRFGSAILEKEDAKPENPA